MRVRTLAQSRVSTVATNYSAVTFKHLLLPVYVGAYRFRDKVYQVVVNGFSGTMAGQYPYSAWKIAFLVLVALIIAFIVILAQDM